MLDVLHHTKYQFIVLYGFGNKYLVHSGQYNFPALMKYYKEGRVELEVFRILIGGGLLAYGFHFLCVVTDTIGKCYTANKCKDYTDSQTKSLSQMFTKTRKIFRK